MTRRRLTPAQIAERLCGGLIEPDVAVHPSPALAVVVCEGPPHWSPTVECEIRRTIVRAIRWDRRQR